MKPPPSYAPVYAAAMYPELAEIAKRHGYALAVHGSLQRDLDLIAVPWVECPSCPEDLLKEFCTVFALEKIGGIGQKPHGRTVYTLSCGFGQCAIDIGFMPVLAGKGGE